MHALVRLSPVYQSANEIRSAELQNFQKNMIGQNLKTGYVTLTRLYTKFDHIKFDQLQPFQKYGWCPPKF